jgi:hypothetical protein
MTREFLGSVNATNALSHRFDGAAQGSAASLKPTPPV